MFWMIKNSSGKKDSMLTFAVLGFIVTVFSIFVSLVKIIKFGNISIEINNPDVTLVTALLGGTLIAYVTRMNKKQQFEHEEKMKKLENNNLNNRERGVF